MSPSLLSVRGVRKSFGPVEVLAGVDLSVERGQLHALLGENGAGKSTLMRILLGLESADGGEVTLCGAPYRPRSAAEARALGVVMVPQERTLCLHATVAENIVLGIEPTRGRFGILDHAASRAMAEHALSRLTRDGRDIPLWRRAGDLSIADQQIVEIARALAAGQCQAGGAKLLVLDEPTSSLGKADAQRLFAQLADLKASGLSFILVTHFLGDVRDHADRYTVLRDGRSQAEGDPRATPSEAIVREMLGRELEAALATSSARAESGVEREEAEPAILLEVEELAGENKPTRATFRLRRGEVFGIAGLVGAGRTELLRTLAGLDRVRSGRIRWLGSGGVGLLSEDRGGEGLMLGRSIGENVTLSPRGPWFMPPRKASEAGERAIAELNIRARGGDQPVGELSGGNQQKVQVARLLREDFDVLLIDEPTRGIDVASKAQILALVRQVAEKGKAIVLVSSQFDELMATCDRIAVLRGGALLPSKPVRDWSEEALLLEAAS